jgi:hypothetical protein
LHHLLGENIFGFLENFAHWCISTERVKSWFDYGRIEKHVENMVSYCCEIVCKDESLKLERVVRLKQLLLYELAPFISIHKAKNDFLPLWNHPQGVTANSLSVAEPASAWTRAYWFLFDDLVEYDTHPKSAAEALDRRGKSVAVLIEARGTSFRRSLFEPSAVSDQLRTVSNDHIFLAEGVDIDLFLNSLSHDSTLRTA